MLCAVVPAQNEEKGIGMVIKSLLNTPVDLIIPVINGCEDNTLSIVRAMKSPRIQPLCFSQALGIDVPRVAGAKYAYDHGAQAILFIDGDMVGNLTKNLVELFAAITSQGVDLALTNCYPKKPYFQSSTAKKVLFFRKLLNQQLGLFAKIRYSSPSHGPHAVSRKFLELLPLKELAIPPVTLALAQKYDFNIKVATVIPHRKLGSPIKDSEHCQVVAATIIGDCLEAKNVYLGLPRDRTYQGRQYLGYHAHRRWDLLTL